MLPLLILQDLTLVSRGTTQGPAATSLSAQFFRLTIRSVFSARPSACMGETEDQRALPNQQERQGVSATQVLPSKNWRRYPAIWDVLTVIGGLGNHLPH
jgi:hypothetical protein